MLKIHKLRASRSIFGPFSINLQGDPQYLFDLARIAAKRDIKFKQKKVNKLTPLLKSILTKKNKNWIDFKGIPIEEDQPENKGLYSTSVANGNKNIHKVI